ncbi:hypothetical protein FNF28_05629 [Cafeteria roenbergensis]|uniref:Protein kinase domain-containing protein n=1 Tax=Cafeteria roenbergensis TaxID=33653 RepID=A0A5A8D7F2_CAFRO|nr:hypothetical protein FNF28_05629 [Cafeteria roenbergensis]
MAAGLEAEKAVPVTEVQDHSRQRDLFNLAGIAHDEAHFDKMVVLVTRHGCDPNARNTAANYHYTPMHQAAVAGNIESLAVLIGLGGNVNVFDGAEYSPMHRACSHAKYQSVALLIAFGADVVLPGRHGNTPLHVAAFMESSRCLGVILASGKAELERRNGPEHNATALMRAVEGGTLRCVKALVKAGADLFATRVWPSRAEVARVKAAGGKLPTPIEETASDLANRLGDGPIAGYLAQQMRTRTDGKAAFEAFQDMREERAAAAASEADAAAKAQAAADMLAEAARGGEAVASGDDAATEPRQAGPDSMPLGAGLHYSGPRALRSGRTASAAVRGEGGEASDVSELYELSEAAKEQRRRQQSLRLGEALFGGNVASDATMREREGLAPRAVDRGASLAEVLTEEAVAAFLAKHASGVAALQAALDSRAAETGPVADAPSKPGSPARTARGDAPGFSPAPQGIPADETCATRGGPVGAGAAADRGARDSYQDCLGAEEGPTQGGQPGAKPAHPNPRASRNYEPRPSAGPASDVAEGFVTGSVLARAPSAGTAYSAVLGEPGEAANDQPAAPAAGAAGAALSAPGASVSGAGAMTAGTAASAGTPVAEAGSRAATAFVPSPLAYRPVTGSFKMVRFHPTEDKDDGAQRRMQELDDEAARLGLARTWSSAASPSAGSATTGPSLSPVRTAFVRALSEAKPLDTDGAIPRVDVSQLLFRESDVMGEGKDKEVFKGWVQPEDGGELLPVAIAKLKSANASKTKEHGFMEALAGCPGVSQLVAWAVDKHYNYYAFVFAQYGDLAQQANRVGQAVRADWSRRVAPALVRSTAAKAMELLRTSAAATGPPRAEAPGARSSLDCYASAGIEPRHDPTLAGADASDIDRAAMQAVLSLGAEAIEPVVASLRSCAREVQRACEAWTEPVWLDSGVMSAPSVFGRVMPATAALVVSPTVLLQGCLQAARGLLAISDLGAIHGDFAARNVLVLEMQEHAPFADASRFRVAVSDFGMSLWVTTEESVVPREAPDGMPMRWQSPEVFRSKKFSAKGDVWSWAVMCWELLTLGAGPFLDRDFPHTECFSNEGKPLGINAAAAYGVEGTAPLFLDDAVREAQNAQAKGRGRRWAPSAVTYGQPRLRLGRPGIGVTSSAAAAARIERMRLDGADDAAIAAAVAAATASHPWIPNDMWSLMQQCWAEAPAMRPSFRAVVAEMEGIVAGLHKGR